MNLRIWFVLIGCVLIHFELLACDACACMPGAGGIGLFSGFRTNFIALEWQLAHFRGDAQYGLTNKDNYQTITLSGRYYISKRFKLLGSQSFQINTRLDAEQKVQIAGLGDTRIIASYSVLDTRDKEKPSSFFWELGAGLKLPTGPYDSDIHNKGVPSNFNTGNGSWATLVQSNAVWYNQKLGFSGGVTYQRNWTGPENYHFGDQLTAQLVGFVPLKVNPKTSVSPFAGVSFETVGKDHYDTGNKVHGTGGNGLFTSLGLQGRYNRWLLNTSVMIPIKQSYSGAEVIAQERLSFQLSYTF